MSRPSYVYSAVRRGEGPRSGTDRGWRDYDDRGPSRERDRERGQYPDDDDYYQAQGQRPRERRPYEGGMQTQERPRPPPAREFPSDIGDGEKTTIESQVEAERRLCPPIGLIVAPVSFSKVSWD